MQISRMSDLKKRQIINKILLSFPRRPNSFFNALCEDYAINKLAQQQDTQSAEIPLFFMTQVEQGLKLYRAHKQQAAVRKWRGALKSIRHREDKFTLLGYLYQAYMDWGKYRQIIIYIVTLSPFLLSSWFALFAHMQNEIRKCYSYYQK